MSPPARRRFLDAELNLPRTPLQALRQFALALCLSGVAALGALALWGPTMGVPLVAAGAFLGAGLRACGVDVLRTPRAWWAAFGAAALVLVLALAWLLR